MDQPVKGKLSFDAFRGVKLACVIGACFLLSFSCSWFEQPKVKESPKANITEPSPPDPSPTRTGNDYSEFDHSNPAHDALSCLLCHTREEKETRVSFPGINGHMPCAGCHQVEFADQSSTMCTICHTDAKAGQMKRFPPLRSFNAKFDHGRHMSQTSCATCHQPSRGGVALSIPAGGAAHSTCFACHTADAKFENKDIASCATCHEAGRPPAQVSEWARAFSFSFSHAEHRRGMSCTNCHNVLASMPRGGQVTSPRLAMHFATGRQQSCATCHNNKRAFGTDDAFMNCKRCHEGNSFGF